MSVTSALDAAMHRFGVLVGEVPVGMAPEDGAARLSMSLLPGFGISGNPGQVRAFNAHAVYARFAREVVAEAGPAVLAEIVHTVERSAALTRGVLPGPTLADGLAHLTAAGPECIATAPGYADMDPEWVHGSFWCALHDGGDGRAS
ncbi:hypothetical protein [Nocardioides sp. BYT-33-1]|uniref:hypothetical protein n=1 Tax=Nocardioides sp. BYT-33-1 TaxID=3416952 RepID=UPI003F52AD00